MGLAAAPSFEEGLMRFVMVLAAFAVSSAAYAQQARPQGQARPPATPPAAAAAPAPPAAPPIFLCRTADEICTLGIATGPSQIAVLFTNAPDAQVADKPIDVSTGEAPGTPLDLAPHLGRVVMLTGTYDAKGLTKAELVEVASPLVSMLLKAQIAAAAEEEQPPPPAPGASKPAPGRKR